MCIHVSSGSGSAAEEKKDKQLSDKSIASAAAAAAMAAVSAPQPKSSFGSLPSASAAVAAAVASAAAQVAGSVSSSRQLSAINSSASLMAALAFGRPLAAAVMDQVPAPRPEGGSKRRKSTPKVDPIAATSDVPVGEVDPITGLIVTLGPSELPDGKIVCGTCDMVLTTMGAWKQHNRKHTGEKKYVCNWDLGDSQGLCGKAFARSDKYVDCTRWCGASLQWIVVFAFKIHPAFGCVSCSFNHPPMRPSFW